MVSSIIHNTYFSTRLYSTKYKTFLPPCLLKLAARDLRGNKDSIVPPCLSSVDLFARPSPPGVLFFIAICFTSASHFEAVKRAQRAPRAERASARGGAFKFKRI